MTKRKDAIFRKCNFKNTQLAVNVIREADGRFDHSDYQ
jgi:hypothetical protein